MKRDQVIIKTVLSNIEEKCFGIKKLEGYQHLISVSTLMTVIASKRGLDSTLASCIGILHDYATYYTNTSFDHATRSSILAKEVLEKTTLFTKNEVLLITTAIANHSKKELLQDVYSELIKDVDIYIQYLQEPTRVFSQDKQKRIHKIKEELEM